MSYKQLSLTERQQLYILKHEQGLGIRTIAAQLGRAPSTISRELRCNGVEGRYLPDTAHQLCTARRQHSKLPFSKVSSSMLSLIYAGLSAYHSPQQVSGRLRLEGRECVSHETIYQMVYADFGGLDCCKKYLRQGRPKRHKRGGLNRKRGQIPGRVDIDERPAIAAEKVEIGHWEGDTVIGANHQGGIVTLVDKHSKYLLAGLIGSRKASGVRRVCEKLLMKVPSEQLKTLTLDNGKEFSEHERLSENTGVKCYFAKPYHSWERGLNEHTNGQLRQFFGKSTNFKIVKEEQLQKVVDLLKDRPRKSLGYRTPQEVFLGQPGPVALHS